MHARARAGRARVRSPGKYPLGNRLYHLAILVVGLPAAITGHVHDAARPHSRSSRATRICWPTRPGASPTCCTAWPASALVGLVIAHVYFAVRPEKWWITKGMIFGWITRRQLPRAPRSGALEGERQAQPRAAREHSSRHARRSPRRAEQRAATPSKSATSSCSPTPAQGLASESAAARAARSASS